MSVAHVTTKVHVGISGLGCQLGLRRAGPFQPTHHCLWQIGELALRAGKRAPPLAGYSTPDSGGLDLTWGA